MSHYVSRAYDLDLADLAVDFHCLELEVDADGCVVVLHEEVILMREAYGELNDERRLAGARAAHSDELEQMLAGYPRLLFPAVLHY